MFRFPAESSSLNTYVPGGRTFPGTSTGALKVTIVFLSNSLPEALGTNPILRMAAHNSAMAIARIKLPLEVISNMYKPPLFGCSLNLTAHVPVYCSSHAKSHSQGFLFLIKRIDLVEAVLRF